VNRQAPASPDGYAEARAKDAKDNRHHKDFLDEHQERRGVK